MDRIQTKNKNVQAWIMVACGLAIGVLWLKTGQGQGVTSLQFTLTAKVAPKADFWYEGFQPGVSFPDLRNWLQGPNANLWLARSTPPAGILRLTATGEGRVSSPLLLADVDRFGIVEARVEQLDSGLAWKLRVQDANQSTVAWESPWTQTAGRHTFHFASQAGWAGTRQFRIHWVVRGAAGQSLRATSLALTGFSRQDPPESFVRRRPELAADQLYLGETVVKLKGANYYPGNHGWRQMWTEWEPGQIAVELDRCQALGVNAVRIFLPYDSFGAESVHAAMLARLEEFLCLAERRQLKVVVSLFDLALEMVAPSLIPPSTTSPPASEANKQKLDQQMLEIVGQFKQDARILGWCVTNELDLHTTRRCTAAVEADADLWHNRMAGMLKAVDSRHLVIAASCRPETVFRWDLGPVDAFALHTSDIYDREGVLIDRTIRWLQQSGQPRPVIFEEFGRPYPLAPTPSPVPEEATAFYNRVWQDIHSRDIAGGMIWLLNDTEWRDTPSSPSTPHPYGLYTAAGLSRIDPVVFRDAYQGTDWSTCAPVPRPCPTPTPAPVADGLAHEILASQELNLAAKWNTIFSGAAIADGQVLIQVTPAAASLFYYGSIQQRAVATPANSCSLDLDQAADIRIVVPTTTAVAGQWYAFLHHWPEGAEGPDYSVRLQQDTYHTGSFWYRVKDFLPAHLASGVRRFMLEIGLSNTWRWGNQTHGRVAAYTVYNGYLADQQFLWQDPFVGEAPEEPAGWMDERQDSGFNATISYAGQSRAQVTRSEDPGSWGKVLSPVIRPDDVLAFPFVEVRVLQCTADTVWRVGIQEVENTWKNVMLNPSSNQLGTFRFRYPEAMGWAGGSHSFRIQVVVEGVAGKNLILDEAGVLGLTTPSMTVTATATPHLTATATPVAGW